MSFDPTGYTLAHEHLHIDLSGFKNNVDCRLDQYAFICQEMNDLMTRGVRNVIEMTNRYMGRNAQFMLDVMRETGINVVACTGYYQDAFFPEHVATRSVQELAQEMVDEIEQGIDGTELKAGIIAEIGTSEGKITPLEEKVFIAAALRITRPDARSPRIRRSARWGWSNWRCYKPTGLIFRASPLVTAI